MKKFLFAALILTVCYSIANAQLVLGVKAGAGLSNIALVKVNIPAHLNVEDYDYCFSFQGGISAAKAISEKLSVVGELLYEVKGTNFPSSDISPKTRLSLHYLSIPILANYELFRSFQIELGPQISYRLAANIENLPNSAPFTAEDIYNVKWDLGLSAGGRYYPCSNLYLGVRYTHGLLDVSDLKFTDMNGLPTLDMRVKQLNRVFHLTLGYEFK
ncbi:MAG TPA: porin family protein [Saprospiraceae bacterium]|nr:porin family protein [Saprospiraceae bacterium]HMP22770.1 porin family protein [Saprospiraceae bacterium]